jgi:PIN domain nuclease of toxin-antitoxin system
MGNRHQNRPWEIPAVRPVRTVCNAGNPSNNFVILPIEVKHTAVLTTLPHHHGDPFDRLIISQAMVEKVQVVSADAKFDSYPVQRLW